MQRGAWRTPEFHADTGAVFIPRVDQGTEGPGHCVIWGSDLCGKRRCVRAEVCIGAASETKESFLERRWEKTAHCSAVFCGLGPFWVPTYVWALLYLGLFHLILLELAIERGFSDAKHTGGG